VTASARQFSATDVSSTAFWATTALEREQTFGYLRDNEPVTWQRPGGSGLMPTEENDGYWAVVRHSDIKYVSMTTDLFCSGQGVQMENAPQVFLDATQSFLAMDAPRHTKLRRLVSAAFTPRRVARIEDQIASQASRIVDELLEVGACDFVRQVSMRLPMWTICEMMGVPAEQQVVVADGADSLVSFSDEEVLAGREPIQLMAESVMALHGVANEMIAARRQHPQDDLMTNLVEAEVDGDRLADAEIAAFFVLLAVAGNDTTRNTITHSVLALQDNPDERQYLLDNYDDRIGAAIEEFVRWSSPILSFRRTALADAVIADQKIAKGEKVVMFYPSGNRDSTVFAEPNKLDLSRNPNPHQGFGGGGPHFCMGHMLAKSQLRAILKELLFRVPNLNVGEPVYLVSSFVHAVKSLPCTL
jgi:cytochrome P450